MTRMSMAAWFERYGVLLAVAFVAVAYVLLRANWTTTPDGDPALHLRLIKDIAETGTIPSELPYTPARVEEGGEIAAMFPDAYPPLYHALGALAYSAAGMSGVLTLNAIAAAFVACSIFMLTRRETPTLFAGAASLGFLASPSVLGPYRSPYMEPVMLAFIFTGGWLAYVAFETRRLRYALLSGLLLGLALATRQNALFVVLGIGAVLALGIAERAAWRPGKIAREWPWVIAVAVGFLTTAVPALLFLAVRTGAIGYADNWLPGMSPSLSIDPAANEYIANITKPDASPGVWLDRYRSTLVYTESWAPEWSSFVVIGVAMAGVAYLHSRGGGSRFLARWVVAQVAIDAAMLVTLHGNPRYVIASQILFHTAVAFGIYAIVAEIFRWALVKHDLVRVAGAAAAAALILAAVFELAPHNSREVDAYLRTGDRDLRNFRGAEYAEMGSWVNANTSPSAIILTPRTYTALLTWERNVAWVTFYGNAWVVDAITTSEPQRANEILNTYGIDYVLLSDPPGVYLDAMPSDGMRSYLQLNNATASEYFELIQVTTADEALALGGREVEHGLRLYEVKKPTEANRARR